MIQKGIKMKLPDFILNYAKNYCDMKTSDENIFRFARMLFENKFDNNEIEMLVDYIDDFIGM